MIKTYCDICGRELKEDCSDQVNLDFNFYGSTGFELKLEQNHFKGNELNLCVSCAESVVSDIEGLRKMRRADDEQP